MLQRSHQTFQVPCFSGTCLANRVPSFSGTQLLRYLTTQGPSFTGTQPLRYLASQVPRYSGTQLLRYLASQVPSYTGTQLFKYLATPVPSYSSTQLLNLGTQLLRYLATQVLSYSGTQLLNHFITFSCSSILFSCSFILFSCNQFSTYNCFFFVLNGRYQVPSCSVRKLLYFAATNFQFLSRREPGPGPPVHPCTRLPPGVSGGGLPVPKLRGPRPVPSSGRRGPIMENRALVRCY